MLTARTVEQQASRFNRRSAQHYYFSECLFSLLRYLIDERYAFGISGFRVDDDVACDRIRRERQSAGLCRRGQGRTGTAEVGISRTTSIAMSAVVTSRATVVSLSQYRSSPNRNATVFPTPLDPFFQKPFAASHLHRRQEFSVR